MRGFEKNELSPLNPKFISSFFPISGKFQRILQRHKTAFVVLGVVICITLSYCFYNQKPTNKFSEEENRIAREMWNYLYEKKYTCAKEEYIGGANDENRDGAYYICKDRTFWPFPSKTEAPCLVYSFGIDWDFSFDNKMAELGCEVHSFDPSMASPDGAKQKSGVIFHKIGIAKTDNDNGFKGWKMRTLKTLMRELGHENRSLDYLKVDTDKGDGTGFEDVLMEELLETGLFKCIRQFAIEIHLPGPFADQKYMDRCKRIYRQLTALEQNGIRLYHTVDNFQAAKVFNSDITQEKIKKLQLEGFPEVALWESHFVNVDFQGKCPKMKKNSY